MPWPHEYCKFRGELLAEMFLKSAVFPEKLLNIT